MSIPVLLEKWDNLRARYETTREEKDFEAALDAALEVEQLMMAEKLVQFVKKNNRWPRHGPLGKFAALVKATHPPRPTASHVDR